MRFLKVLILPLITIVIVVLLNSSVGSLPPLGKLLDPVNGWAANAESTDNDFNRDFSLAEVKQPVSVWFEGRMVPHIRAANDHDLYFTQGYIHAYFRLWQMDFQTRAAAGRIGEVVGEKWIVDKKTGQRKNAILEFDRYQRRKGMVYAAENSLNTMEADPRTKEMLDAYTEGINNYIQSLRYKDYPLEYKLMNYRPEPWNNVKTALLLKYMADDLTGYTEDIPLTILRDQLTKEEFDYLFPQRIKGSVPVIPAGTKFDPPSLQMPPAPTDSIWTHFRTKGATATSGLPSGQSAPCLLPFTDYSTGIGSNNWAISGAHTASGAPILCNDPHLGLNLPSLWFEMQLQAPGLNVYGVSLPGAPGVIIGFNDSLSWGLTNNYRDVKDFYSIEAIDKDFYRFDGKPSPFDKRIEVIKIKGKPDFVDTIDYTVHGPVTFDEHFPDPQHTNRKLAMQWMAHRGTNELLAVYLLNRAKDYIGFTEAILHFQCPAQNFVYADRSGNIAMWGQGQFVNKWKDQGRYVMEGNTSKTLWGADIPMTENPHVLNPPQGYLASANQVTTDSTYPYWYNGYFSDFRAWRINEILRNSLPKDIVGNMKMQNDVVSILARESAAKIDSLINDERTPESDNWDFTLKPESKKATGFQTTWSLFYQKLWEERFTETLMPSPERTIQILNTDSMDNPYLSRMKLAASEIGKPVTDSLSILQKNGSLEWYNVKNTSLTHLAKIPAFSYDHLKIGGSGNTINAAKSNHGPSWRMIVELDKDSIRAYGVYPGGQSGDPGSKYYGTFVNNWVDGKYYRLLFLRNVDQQDNKMIKYTWTIKPGK
ncbi:MAG TPA: penicillin acylase family protein [Flavipsychrobacter sp.]|nr:penicillin acylase family protein [Flavipsychrobacter sp.]